MAMTIPRTNKVNKGTMSMERHFNDLYEMPHDIAIALSVYGPLAQAIASMAIEKVKRAKVDARGKSLLDKRKSVYAKIDKKVAPVLAAMSKAVGDDLDIGEGFRDLVAAKSCKSELQEIADIDAALAQLALSHKQDIVDKALTTLMGKPTSGSGFPFADTVYVVNNNGNRWSRLAFAFESGNVPSAVYASNGEKWDTVDVDLSNEHCYKLFTSPRALLKFAYVYNTLPDRLPTMLASVDDQYNPMAGIAPKANPEIEEFPLGDWLDSW